MSGGIFLARMAGLPVDALATAARDRLAPALDDLDRTEARLTAARSLLVATLFDLVPRADPELRPFLLAVKRHCFNQRPLRTLAGDPRLPLLDGLLAGGCASLMALEDEVQAATAELSRAYHEERDREGEMLAQSLLNLPFLRAINLATRDLIPRAMQLEGAPRRRLLRAETSLLRYMSRAAFKLSPFSTLTRIGLGEVVDGDPGPGLRLIGHDLWHEHSLVRTRRDLLDSVAALLIRYPLIQQGLRVSLNDTLREDQPGVFRLIRPMQYERHQVTGEFRWASASFVKGRIDGPVPRWLLAELKGRSLSYSELVRALELGLDLVPASPEDEGLDLRAVLDQLLSLGFLQLEAPWHSHIARLEDSVLAYLEAQPLDDALSVVQGALRNLVAAEDRYDLSADPPGTILEMDRAARELAASVSQPFPGINPMPAGVDPKYNFYQDIFITGRNDGGHGPRTGDLSVVRLPSASLAAILETGDVLWTLANFFHPRWNFQHALAALVSRRWPGLGAGPVDLLEVFGEARQLWKDYIQWTTTPSSTCFNPYGLPLVDDLERLRRDLRERIAAGIGDATDVAVPALRRVCEHIPACYDPIVGSCVYVQQAGVGGDLWVLNRLFEGTGRFGSRFTVAMPPVVQRRYVSAFTRRSRLWAAGAGGEDVELLDILYAHENTVNIHLPQTPRVMIIPGERTDLPRERQVQLSELRLAIDGGSELPIIRNDAGQRFLPCHMTPANGMHMPVLAKFLATLGPSSALTEIIPHAVGVRTEGEMTIATRLTVGPLVFRRQRWVFPSRLVPGGGAARAESFRAITRWFAARGLPNVFFVIERVSPAEKKPERFKPQLVDLRSPAFVEMLAGILQRQEEITIEEALPLPSAFPADDQGRQWGIELMLDSLVLGGSVRQAGRQAALDALDEGTENAVNGEAAVATLHSREPFETLVQTGEECSPVGARG